MAVAVLAAILLWPVRPETVVATTSQVNAGDGTRAAVNSTIDPVRPVASIADGSIPESTPLEVSRREIAEEEVATIALFKAAAPSVVHITTHSVQRDYFSMNLQKIPRGSGTGFVWDKQGHIVTNFHVIKGADLAYVDFGDQQNSTAKLVGAAPEKDLAVLKIEADPAKLRPLPLGTSSNLEVGLKALAIGNPFGLDHTLTTGIVSALGREIESTTGLPIKDVIQTDAAINPGNSGGPLLDSSGRLIGVNTAIYSPSGTYAGIGFAIPVDVVKWVVPELIQHGKVTRAGIAVGYASDRMIAQFGLPGVLILEVKPVSEAARAKLRATRRNQFGEILLGDIIVGIGQEIVRNNKDLILELEKYKVGERVTLKLLRNGEPMEVDVLLELAE
ncbi:MAG: trypsin-like serine protease [Pirellulaceae bacterium]|nr:trypsin-like serine protease [Pirellulaceae bacterium]